MTRHESATADTLVVSEVFGPTIQGEGPSVGRPASFVRLGGCNLSCQWCDTAYTWDSARYDLRAELRRDDITTISDRALFGDPAVVVITGGEPLLHQRQPAWTRLLTKLARADVDIEIETNGTLTPTAETCDLGVWWNVSPKLAHSGDPAHLRIRHAALNTLIDTGRASLKFVCATEADVDEAAELVHDLEAPHTAVWISPEGTTASDVLTHTRQIADATVQHGFNLGTRLHIFAWGDERGR